MKELHKLYNDIQETVFTINPKHSYDSLIEDIIKLCHLIDQCESNDDWLYIGEHQWCCLSDFIIGAYWHFTEWHEGQDSSSYAALCALGDIFSPGMSDGPEAETSEQCTYENLESLAKESIAA